MKAPSLFFHDAHSSAPEIGANNLVCHTVAFRFQFEHSCLELIFTNILCAEVVSEHHQGVVLNSMCGNPACVFYPS